MIGRKWVLGLAMMAALPLLADDDDDWRRRDRDRGPWGGVWDRDRDRDRDRDVWRRDRDRDRDRDRGRWGGIWRGSRRGNDAFVVDQAMSNLRRVASRNRYDSHERNHFERALYHLGNFRERYRREGRFDRGRLNDAIEHIDDLAKADQIHPRDRSLLARDLQALRHFRSSGGDMGRW